jgi:hypothetical protein
VYDTNLYQSSLNLYMWLWSFYVNTDYGPPTELTIDNLIMLPGCI